MITADLSGKTAIVTGGASGVGLATVAMLARNGAKVAMNHRASNQSAGREIERLKGKGLDVISAPGDISQSGEAEAMVKAAIDKLGRLDILVNNAGTPGSASKGRRLLPSDLDILSDDMWQEVLATNLVGAFHCVRVAASALRAARGSVVNTASIAGIGPFGSNLVYGASKAALISLTTYLSRSLAPEVRVNAVAPGYIDTPWTKDWPEEVKTGAISRTPL
jgi:3-oxoacyl-[acyl-carrier protein] reductase